MKFLLGDNMKVGIQEGGGLTFVQEGVCSVEFFGNFPVRKTYLFFWTSIIFFYELDMYLEKYDRGKEVTAVLKKKVLIAPE